MQIFHMNFLPTQYISVQFSCLVVSDSLRPHGLQHARLPCPSPTNRVHPNPCPLSRWCHPTISSSVIPFSSCPQSFPFFLYFLRTVKNLDDYVKSSGCIIYRSSLWSLCRPTPCLPSKAQLGSSFCLKWSCLQSLIYDYSFFITFLLFFGHV